MNAELRVYRYFDLNRGRFVWRIKAGSQPHHRADLCGPFGRTMP